MFLRDIYNEGRILDDGAVVSARDRLQLQALPPPAKMVGLQVPRNVYVAICGTDLIRMENGEFVVLEDNLRVPSGRFYMLTPAR